ncbi:MAG: redox-sensing transcriptional repressor [Verrucomicrobiales bacterium]|jgi:redox-sensing transcriptional repressor
MAKEVKQEAAIPRKSIFRLSIYQRCLERLRKNGMETVSSEVLAKAAGVKPTQLRKDLTYFGQFGTRGLGYNVESLSATINEVLGTNSLQPVVLVGVGNLGAALLRYQGFQKEGFELRAAFDSDHSRCEEISKHSGIPVHPVDEMRGFVQANSVKMAILTVPARVAQEVANELVEAGVQAILNFSPTVLQVPDKVMVHAVDLALALEHLSYFVRSE